VKGTKTQIQLPMRDVLQRKFRSTWGNEERENRYWTEGEERRCRICNEARETIRHMWNDCSEMRERERKEQGEILNEDGRDERYME
jgi:hypothetical protein